MLPNTTLPALLAFRDERDWQPFHTPKNLTSALVVEAAELLEIFQWAADAELPQLVERERGAIADEMADIGILLSYLCHDLGIDLEAAMAAKIEKNRAKYPVEKSRGHAKKYDRL